MSAEKPSSEYVTQKMHRQSPYRRRPFGELYIYIYVYMPLIKMSLKPGFVAKA